MTRIASISDRPKHIGLRRAWSALLRELRAVLRHYRGLVRSKRRDLHDAAINVGCGKHPLPGWVNTDLFVWADLVFDIRERWPIADDQARLVRLEHVLEHVEYPRDATHVLAECFRVLQPGGFVRVGVPDTGAALMGYVQGPQSAYMRMAKERWHPRDIRSPIEHVNFHFRGQYGEHLFAYDAESLHTLLDRAGFLDIQTAGFDATIDRRDREPGTIRLCGVKPHSAEGRP